MAVPGSLDEVLHELQVHQAELESQNRELRDSREALEASRARYADLFDFAPVGYMTLDDAQKVLDVNLTGARLLGHERDRMVGKPLRALVKLDEPDVLGAHLRRCRQTRETTKTEMAFVRGRDGAHVEAQLISLPVTEPGDDTFVYRTALVDVTERRVAARELEHALQRERAGREELQRARDATEEASRLKDEFLSIVSHELRTPLNAILGWASMLTSSHARDTAKTAHGLEVIKRNAEAQARVVDDLLDVSRMITGKLRVDLRSWITLEDVVRAAVETIEPAAAAKGVGVVTHCTAEVSVMGDAERLQQVVWNLLSNALKFTEAGGEIRIEIDADDSWARVRVSDTGCGIPASALPWIFDRFRQVDASPQRLQGGLGLGLAIVRHIVELHGGHARAESPGPGRGSTFDIELPRPAVRASGTAH